MGRKKSTQWKAVCVGVNTQVCIHLGAFHANIHLSAQHSLLEASMHGSWSVHCLDDQLVQRSFSNNSNWFHLKSLLSLTISFLSPWFPVLSSVQLDTLNHRALSPALAHSFEGSRAWTIVTGKFPAFWQDFLVLEGPCWGWGKAETISSLTQLQTLSATITVLWQEVSMVYNSKCREEDSNRLSSV